MRLDKYRDHFLSCRLLIAHFLLFAVRTWRLQRHGGGEWLKLSHCKGGMRVMCTENCCTGQESMASSSFFLAQRLDTWMCPVHSFSHPQSSSPETAPEFLGKCACLGPILPREAPNHDTSCQLYKPALWGSTVPFVHARKVRAVFKTTVHAELKQIKCDFNIFSVKLLPEKYTISGGIPSPCHSQPLKTVNCHIIIKLHL